MDFGGESSEKTLFLVDFGKFRRISLVSSLVFVGLWWIFVGFRLIFRGWELVYPGGFWWVFVVSG